MRKVEKDTRYLEYPIYRSEDGDEETVFRFDTKYSACHSFNDKPPTKWEEVYKVYYYYQIVRVSHTYQDANEEEILFDSRCDECSIIDEVAARCKLLAEGKKQVKIDRDDGKSYTIKLLNQDIMPCGMGVFWKILKVGDNYKFELFDWSDRGYRFYVHKERISDFGEFLDGCCEYMLAHGVPI